MLLELNDICFFVKTLKLCEVPNHSFIISKYISFSQNNTTSGTFSKLVQSPILHNRDKQFYFCRLPHLWNSLPPIDLLYKSIVCNYQKTTKRNLLEVIPHQIQPRCKLFLLLLVLAQGASPSRNPVSTNSAHDQEIINLKLLI